MLEPRDEPPRPSLWALAASAGLLWGLLCYAVLWEGVPIVVQRPFVDSVGGTLALLPIRVVLWAIHVLETLAGRSFDLSRNHWWIGVLAALVGLATTSAVLVIVRGLARRFHPRLRRSPGSGSMSA